MSDRKILEAVREGDTVTVQRVYLLSPQDSGKLESREIAFTVLSARACARFPGVAPPASRMGFPARRAERESVLSAVGMGSIAIPACQIGPYSRSKRSTCWLALRTAVGPRAVPAR